MAAVRPPRLSDLSFAVLALAFVAPAPATAAPCDDATVAVATAAPGGKPFNLTCDLTLPTGATVARRLVFAGAAASNLTLDCNGGRLAGKGDVLVIRSRGKDWTAMAADRPTGITIRNCVVAGGLRIIGLGPNGQSDKVRQSSLSEGHTARAQAAAPSGIRLENLTFEPNGRIPLYLAPGVTDVTLTGSKFTGKSDWPSVYLDAESAGNHIVGNDFAMADRDREVIAIDGSANNEIAGNTFRRVDNGGIFLYRNCGEGGTVRHQKPTGNRITGNTFIAGSQPSTPTVWLGSRQNQILWRMFTFCGSDDGHPFGSSASNDDFADGNVVTGNSFSGMDPAAAIRDDGKGNVISGNVRQD